MLVPFAACFAGQRVDNQYPYIQFLGAAQSIGGSAILVDTGKTRFLVDYGLYYDKDDQQKNNAVLETPQKLKLCPPHPRPYRSLRPAALALQDGFKGLIVGTDATQDIVGRMLDMSVGIAETQGTKLFDSSDMKSNDGAFQSGRLRPESCLLSPDIEVSNLTTLAISSDPRIIEIWIKRGDQKPKLVGRWNMGGRDIPILRDRAQIDDCRLCHHRSDLRRQGQGSHRL